MSTSRDRGPKSDLARYAYGYSDKKPGPLFWAIHVGMIAYIVWSMISPAHAQQQPIYTPSWHRIEADNGAVYAVDLKSIHHPSPHNADAVVYDPEQETTVLLIFDCLGHYQDSRESATHVAPPRSVAGAIQRVVCKEPKQ